MPTVPAPAYDENVFDPNPHCRSTLEREEWGAMGDEGQEKDDEVILLGTVRETAFETTNSLWFGAMVKEGTELVLERQPRDLLGPTTLQLRVKDSPIRLALVDSKLAKSVTPLLDEPEIRVRATANPPTLRLDNMTKELVSRIYTYKLEIYGPRSQGRKTSMLFLFPLRKKRIEQAVKEERVREEREEQARWKGLSPAGKNKERLVESAERRRVLKLKVEEKESRQRARLARSRSKPIKKTKRMKSVPIQREWNAPPPAIRFKPGRM